MQTLLPDNKQSTGQTSNFLLILMVTFMMFWMMSGRPAQKAPPQENAKDQVGTSSGKKDIEPLAADAPKEDAATREETQAADDLTAPGNFLAPTQEEPTWLTLGSLDPNGPYRMLVTLLNRGAAVSRIELAEECYRDVQDRAGYLGQLVADLDAIKLSPRTGCPVQVVGAGTPADRAGLQAGDRIILFQPYERNNPEKPGESTGIASFDELREVLLKTKPGDLVRLQIQRGGEKLYRDVTLGSAPIAVVRPETTPRTYEEYIGLGGLRGYDSEKCDQLSFLMTLYKINDARLGMPESFGKKTSGRVDVPLDATLDDELRDIDMRHGCWKLVSHTPEEAVFRMTVPRFKLEIFKRYRLAQRSQGEAYHLTLGIEIRNFDTTPHTVAYQLDGPTGAPLEGAWYSRKAGPGWGSYGIRDVVVHAENNQPTVISNNVICFDAFPESWKEPSFHYLGVDSTYFQCTMLPNDKDRPVDENGVPEPWLSRFYPIRVGKKIGNWAILTNNSFRIVSTEKELPVTRIAGKAPQATPDNTLMHEYTVFAGPKNPEILADYGLKGTLSYGWFAFFVHILLWFLHAFHGIGLGYGFAIILLTVFVRLCMFPLSLKQAKSMVKMQELKPEIDAIKEKYKNDAMAMNRATNELWKKHNFHPAHGCLGIFIQLPIFVALYKALSVDVELYGVSLIAPALRWCNDLSAPDMLLYWGNFWNAIGLPAFNAGQGVLYLGPYFNILPMLTFVLLLAQQQLMMPKPDPNDQQAQMQRSMMFVMMPMMGLLFFKMPSGLCVYFIVSTLWGLAERQFIPKPAPKTGDAADVTLGSDGRRERPAPDDKSPRSSRKEKPARENTPKEEGFFKKIWREVNEKAAEKQTLEKAKNRKKKK